MYTILMLLKKLKNLNRYSKFSIKLGAFLMVGFYIFAILIRVYAPHSGDYYATMTIYRGCLELAPALLAVGVCAGLLGDLMLRTQGSDDDASDTDKR